MQPGGKENIRCDPGIARKNEILNMKFTYTYTGQLCI